MERGPKGGPNLIELIFWRTTTLLLLAVVAVLLWLLFKERKKRRHDPLTSAPNRVEVKEYAKRFFRAGSKEDRRQAGCVAILDLDRFKEINDNDEWGGHKVGDFILQEFYARCVAQLRVTDLLARWGGEEFLLFMPRTELSQVQGIFDRLRDAVGEIRVEGAPEDWRLTFSMGVVMATTGGDLQEHVDAADAALYRAKNAGRDRLVVGTL